MQRTGLSTQNTPHTYQNQNIQLSLTPFGHFQGVGRASECPPNALNVLEVSLVLSCNRSNFLNVFVCYALELSKKCTQADPGPLAKMFWVDQELESEIYLDGIVCVVDAKMLGRHLDRSLNESVSDSEGERKFWRRRKWGGLFEQ